MTDYQSGPTGPAGPVSRRAALGLGAGLLGGTVLAACSNKGRGADPGAAPKEGLALPITEPRQALPGTQLSKVEGVPPAFTKVPWPGYQSVKSKPGSGGDMTAFTITWGAPPKPLNDNPWHQAINKALGVNLNSTIVPAQSFGEKLVTTIASGDIPDITTNEPSYRGRAARKYLPQGVFHDLREQLGGDKVKQYPNLALVPQYAWKNSRIDGALYGVPCYRNQTIGGTISFRQDWVEKGGGGAKPTNIDELFKWLQAMKAGGGAKTYPLATIDQTFNFCGAAVYRVPNNWKLDNGKLVKDLETEEYEEALVFANKLWKAGLVHPDVLTLTPNPAQYDGYFYSGRVGICNGSIDAYYGVTGQFAQVAQRNPKAKCDVLVPPGADGGHGVIGPDLGYYCMLSIPSSVKDKGRIDEILRVIDYLAAPMGSKEYYLVHYGVQGHDFSMKNGAPVASTAKSAQNESFLSMLSGFSLGFFFPGAEDQALTCQKYAEQMTECFLADPTAGLDSQTSYSKGDALSSTVQDYVNAIVTGRKPVSALTEMRARWKKGGGNQMRKEYEKAITEEKKAEEKS